VVIAGLATLSLSFFADLAHPDMPIKIDEDDEAYCLVSTAASTA